MAERFIKLPMGCTKSADIGIIAKRLNIKKSLVLGVFACASELFFEEKTDTSNNVELIAYTLDESEELIQQIITELKNRKFIDENFRVIGITTISESAERKRRQREKMRQSRDSHANVTDSHGTVTTNKEINRPDQIDQTKETKEKDQTKAATNGDGRSGSFLRVGMVGSVGRFDIEPLLESEDFFQIRDIAPLWDRKELFSKYNAFVANDPPRKPREAFIGWLKKFTQGKGARP